MTVVEAMLYFALYSVFGWVCETIWCTIGERKFVYRGFLHGPYCPVYGFGALIILLVCEPIKAYPIGVFLGAMLAATVLEYFTAWILETLFKTKWWDYSRYKFQIKGRVCLLNSLMFGVLGLVAVYFLHPVAQNITGFMESSTQRIVAGVFLAVFILDFAFTLASVSNLQERLAKIKIYIEEIEHYNLQYKWWDKTDVQGSIINLRAICAEDAKNESAQKIIEAIDKLTETKGVGKRLVSAFPNMKLREKFGNDALDLLKEGWKHKKAEIKTKKIKIKDDKKEKINLLKVYSGLSFTHLVWVFLIGCVIGYFIEMVFCFVTRGYLESRQGMIYGPFSQVYGFGAVLFTLVLAPLAKKSDAWLFIGGGVTGGLFEALAAFVQEKLLGTVSWGYSEQKFPFFGGRTSLLFVFFWAVLSVVYMRCICPAIMHFVDKIAVRPKRCFTIIIVAVLSANMLLSAVAVSRWGARQIGAEPKNQVEMFIDEHYPDETMQEIYPNMQFGTEK